MLSADPSARNFPEDAAGRTASSDSTLPAVPEVRLTGGFDDLTLSSLQAALSRPIEGSGPLPWADMDERLRRAARQLAQQSS